MNENVYYYILLIVLILITGILSLIELAIASSRKVKLQKMKNDGDKRAQTVIELMDNPNEYLSSIQLGISLIGLLTGVIIGSTISNPLEQILESVYHIPFGSTLAMLLVVSITTYFTMIIGELVPKRIALNNPEKNAVRLAKFTKILVKISKPLVIIMSKSTDFLLKIVGVSKVEKDLLAEDEIKLIIKEGIKDGTIEEEEEAILKRVFRLDEEKVDMLMTPKKDIIWIDLDEEYDDLKKTIIESKRSIFPVARDDIDNVLGVVQAKDILGFLLSEEDAKIESFLKEVESNLKKPLIVPENLSALSILKMLKENKKHVHMALVVDEYGNVQGLITLNDILEGIVGDIPGIDETDEPKITKRNDESWLVDGGFGIDSFKEFFKIEEEMPQEDEDEYTTVAGFILSYIEKLPETGETFNWKDFEFEVTGMDGHIIDKILITNLKNTSKEK
jgi:putative hemolysin